MSDSPSSAIHTKDRWPRVTLITPSFNQGRFLEQTLDSVLSQGYPNLEYMVFDGGSTDGSVGIIERYGKHLSYWESQPDKGQSHAIAKGMERATGELANWLNSDDLLVPRSLERVAGEYLATGADLIVGEDDPIDADGQAAGPRFRPDGYAFPDCLRFWTGRFLYHQPCTFFTRESYLRAGGLDTTLHYVMDYDLYCRILAMTGVRVAYLPHPLSAFRRHEGSKTHTAKPGFLREQRESSRRQWSFAGLEADGAEEEMDRYSARCAIYQAASAVRMARPGLAVSSLIGALRYAPAEAVRTILERTLKVAAR
jgi:GT2 family glycosyltransferase